MLRNLSYRTTHNAMKEHAKLHRDNDYIIIGKFDVDSNNENHGFYNPSTHRHDKVLDQMSYSAQAKLHDVRIPPESRTENGDIRCRKCEDFVLPTGGMPLKKKMKAVKRMRKHEAQCVNA